MNAGIIEAHRKGILTATTLMAGGAAFTDAVRLAGENPELDIGVHLQMVQGESLSMPGRSLPVSLGVLIRSLLLGEWDVVKELEAQVEKVLAAGIQPTHLDTHKHTHLLPAVLDAVARVSKKYGIHWVRKPIDLPLDGTKATWNTRGAAVVMRQLNKRFDRVLARYGAASTTHFAGFVWTGNYDAADLVQLIRNLPAGSTEFMCHPGILGAELQAAQTRLKASRQQELVALTDLRVREALHESGVVLSNYRNLSQER